MLAWPEVLLLLGGIFAAVSTLLIITALSRGAWTVLRARWRPAAGPPPYEPSAPRVVLTMIPGTWARRSRWTRPNSSFRRAVSARLNHSIAFRRFEWSGNNTFRARRLAAAALARVLTANLQEHPGAAHFVVAHSHGGNVALRALTPELMDAMAGVACLATPVLVGRARHFDPVLGRVFDWVGVIPSFGATIWLLARVGPVASGDNDPVMGLMATASWGAALGSILLLRTIRRRLATVRFFGDYSAVDATKVAFFRMPGDEASLVIGLAHVLTLVIERVALALPRAATFFMRTCGHIREVVLDSSSAWLPAWLWLGVLAYIALSAAIIADLDGDHFKSWPPANFILAGVLLNLLTVLFTAAPLLDWIMLVLLSAFSAILLVPMGLLTGAISLVLGPELAIAALGSYVTAEVCPPGQWNVVQVSDDGGDTAQARGMQHSAIYASPRALDALCAWIEARVSSSTPR